MKGTFDMTGRRFMEFTDQELQVFVTCLMEQGLFELMCEVKMEQELRERRRQKKEKRGNDV